MDMMRCMLRSKLHMATVTSSELHYEGSITIDADLMKKAGIKPYEQVKISNLNNGERFETYAIVGKPGEVCLNGPTARKGMAGDRIIIFTYSYINDSKIKDDYKPLVFMLNEKNEIVREA